MDELLEQCDEITNKWRTSLSNALDLVQMIVDNRDLIDDSIDMNSLIEKYKQFSREAAAERDVLSELLGCGRLHKHPEIAFKKRLAAYLSENRNNVEWESERIESLKTMLQSNGQNDTLQVEEMFFSRKDPLTKKDIENPVQNKICKHVYDRTSVEQYIEQCKKFRQLCQCPVSACPNKKVLSLTEMIDFPQFFEHIKD